MKNKLSSDYYDCVFEDGEFIGAFTFSDKKFIMPEIVLEEDHLYWPLSRIKYGIQQALSAAGVIIAFGSHLQPGVSPEMPRVKLGSGARSLVDGKGAYRIACEIRALAEVKR